MKDYQKIWRDLWEDVTRQVHEWRKVTPYKFHNQARHIVIMEPGFAADVGAGLRYEMAPYTVQAEANPNQDPPRFPGCTYLWTFEGVEYFSDQTGKVAKYQAIVAAWPDSVDLKSSPFLSKSVVEAAMKSIKSQQWYGKGLFESLNEPKPPDKIDISHVWDKPAVSKAESVASPHGGKILRLTMKGPKDALDHPEDYIVCEGCGDIKNKPSGTLDALLCAGCHGYRFTSSLEDVTAAAKKLMEGRE